MCDQTNLKNETDSDSIPIRSEMETILSNAMQNTIEFSLKSTEKELKELIDQLANINNCLENKVRSNENSYSYWKSTFEKEIKSLKNNYNELRGSERSLTHVKRQLDCIRKDAEEMKTNYERSKLETNRWEKKVERYEPKLFSMYQKMLETPLEEEKAYVREEIRTLITEKRNALDTINSLVKEETDENDKWETDKSWDDDLDETSVLPNTTQSANCPSTTSFSFPHYPPIWIPEPPPLPLVGPFVNLIPNEPANPQNSRVDFQQVQFVNAAYGNYFDYDESDVNHGTEDGSDIELELGSII